MRAHLLLFLLTLPAVSSQATDERGKMVEAIRKALNVNTFSGPDYAPTFGIIAGISVVLVAAVLFIVVGLLSMEPAKDSLIYRMTSTRIKKD